MRGDRLLAMICVIGFSAPALAEELAPNDIAAQIAFKLAAIDALQREVDQLRLQQGASTQLMFHVRMMEVNLTGLRNLGLDVSIFGQPGEVGQPAADDCVLSVEKAKEYRSILENLQQRDAAQLISDPTLVTIPGRPAHFNEGGELPAGRDANGQPIYKKFGTEFEVNARRIGSNRISAKVMLRVSTPQELPSKSGEGPHYAFRVRQCDTGFELNAGETFFLRGAPQAKAVVKHDPASGREQTVEEQTMLLLMVTPEIIEGPIPGAMTTVQTATQNTFDASGFPRPMVTEFPIGVPYPGAQQPPQPVAAPGRPSVVYLPNPVPVPAPTAPPLAADDSRQPINIQTVIAEVNLTKLRTLGHKVSSEQQVYDLLGMTAVKGPVATIGDHDAVGKRVEPFMDQGALTILSSPEIITLDGQDATVSCGNRCPVTGRDTGISLKLVPHLKDNGHIQIEFTGTFTAPKPVPADAPADYAKDAVAVREAQTSFLAAPHQTLALSGGIVERETKSTENGVEKSGVEEIMPLYFITASVPELQEARAVRAVRAE